MKVLVYEHYDFSIHGNQKYLILLFESMKSIPSSDISMLLAVPSGGELYERVSEHGEAVALGKGTIPSRAASLFGVFDAFRPDLVLCNNEPSLITAAPAALIRRVPIVWYIKNMRRFFPTDIFSFLASSRVLTIAPQCMENKHYIFRKAFGRKVRGLPIGIRLEEFADIEPPVAGSGPRRMLLIGFVGHEKGIDLALDSMDKLDSLGISAELRIVGVTPPGREGYEREMRERLGRYSNVSVSILGWRKDIRELLEWSEIVIHPTRSDGVPRGLVEAMAAARPVVASAVGGIPSLIEDGRSGLLVPPDDSRAMTACIRRLFDDRSLARRLGMEAREHVTASHEIDRHRDQLISYLKEVVRHG